MVRAHAVTRNGFILAGVLIGAFAMPIMAGAAEDRGLAATSDPVGMLFRAADRDGNGSVDGREAGAAGAWLFAYVDEDRNGLLSRNEMKTAPRRLTERAGWAESKRLASQLSKVRKYMDRDSNGRITPREFHSFAAYLYWIADGDESGTITQSELNAFLRVYANLEPNQKPHER